MSDTPPIMALDLPMLDPLPEEIQKYFDICQEKLGMVPNVLQAYAFDAAKLNAFSTLYNDLMLAPSGLSKLEREMIAVTVSSINKCFYCLVAHGAAVRQLSGDPKLGEMIAMNYRVAPLDARQKRCWLLRKRSPKKAHPSKKKTATLCAPWDLMIAIFGILRTW